MKGKNTPKQTPSENDDRLINELELRIQQGLHRQKDENEALKKLLDSLKNQTAPEQTGKS